MRVRGIAALGGLLALAGCHRVFPCDDDAQCRLDGVPGTCEAVGHCSFPDEDCDSGRRFGEHAPRDMAGVCVEVDPAMGSTSTGSEDGSSDGTSGTTGESTDDGPAVRETSDSNSSDGGDCPPLVDSDPIVVDADGMTIERVRIESDGEAAIRVDGHTGVTIRDVEIRHRGGPGLVFAGSDDLHVSNVIIVHDGAPEAGPHGSGGQANLDGRDASGVVIDHVRVVAGSSGIVLDNVPAVTLSFIEGHDVRGPGDAAFVRLHESDDAVLEDFSIINPLDTGRPQTLIQISSSSNVTVRRGLMDGHNAEFGYGINFDLIQGQHGGGLVEDVDAVRMAQGGFSCFPWGRDITFRRTRARDNICEIVSIEVEGCNEIGPNGGCIPGSGGVSWTASLTSSNVVIEESAYFNLCSSTHWPDEVIEIPAGGLIEEDFELRAPIEISPCWAE